MKPNTYVEIIGVQLERKEILAKDIPIGKWFLSIGPSTHIDGAHAVWIRLTVNKYYNVSSQFYFETENESKTYWKEYVSINTVTITIPELRD